MITKKNNENVFIIRRRNKRITNKLDWSSPWSRPRSFVFYGSTYPSEGRDQYPFPFRRVLLGIEIVKVIARVHRVHATPKFNNNTTIKTQSTTTTTATTPLLLLLLLHDDGRLFQIHTHPYTAHSLAPINLCNQVHIFQFFLMSVLYATCVTQMWKLQGNLLWKSVVRRHINNTYLLGLYWSEVEVLKYQLINC